MVTLQKVSENVEETTRAFFSVRTGMFQGCISPSVNKGHITELDVAIIRLKSWQKAISYLRDECKSNA